MERCGKAWLLFYCGATGVLLRKKVEFLRRIGKMKKSAVVLMVVSMVGLSTAATLRYQGSGDWFAAIETDGTGWYLNGQAEPRTTLVPGAADTVRFNYGNNIVTLGSNAGTVTAFQAGVDESGTLVVNAGGLLTATGNSNVGNNNFCTGMLIINTGGSVTNNGVLKVGANVGSVSGPTTGIVAINGGTLNIGSHLWAASANTAVGTVNINSGGVVNVAGMLGLGTGNATAASGGIATINVNDGGLLALAQIHAGILTGTGSSIWTGSMLNINGSGVVSKTGDFVNVFNGYIAAGLISGNGVVGNVQAVYDADDLKTYVTAIPEPATVALLGLGALGLLRKKK
jgi:hypothetical protein